MRLINEICANPIDPYVRLGHCKETERLGEEVAMGTSYLSDVPNGKSQNCSDVQPGEMVRVRGH